MSSGEKVNKKRKTRERVGLLLNGEGDLVTKDKEKANILNTFLPHPLLVRPAFRNRRPETRGLEQGRLTIGRGESG